MKNERPPHQYYCFDGFGNSPTLVIFWIYNSSMVVIQKVQKKNRWPAALFWRRGMGKERSSKTVCVNCQKSILWTPAFLLQWKLKWPFLPHMVQLLSCFFFLLHSIPDCPFLSRGIWCNIIILGVHLADKNVSLGAVWSLCSWILFSSNLCWLTFSLLVKVMQMLIL